MKILLVCLDPVARNFALNRREVQLSFTYLLTEIIFQLIFYVARFQIVVE